MLALPSLWSVFVISRRRVWVPLYGSVKGAGRTLGQIQASYPSPLVTRPSFPPVTTRAEVVGGSSARCTYASCRASWLGPPRTTSHPSRPPTSSRRSESLTWSLPVRVACPMCSGCSASQTPKPCYRNSPLSVAHREGGPRCHAHLPSSSEFVLNFH